MVWYIIGLIHLIMTISLWRYATFEYFTNDKFSKVIVCILPIFNIIGLVNLVTGFNFKYYFKKYLFKEDFENIILFSPILMLTGLYFLT